MARIREAGHVPNANFALLDVEEEVKESSLYFHSEKLAIVFGIMNSGPESEIRIHRNLRVCGDCHTATKFISKVTGKEIVVRETLTDFTISVAGSVLVGIIVDWYRNL